MVSDYTLWPVNLPYQLSLLRTGRVNDKANAANDSTASWLFLLQQQTA